MGADLFSKLLGSIIEGAASYGPLTTLLLYLWLSERAERRALQEQKDVINDRAAKGLADTKVSIDAMQSIAQSILLTITTLRDWMLAGRAAQRQKVPAPRHGDNGDEG